MLDTTSGFYDHSTWVTEPTGTLTALIYHDPRRPHTAQTVVVTGVNRNKIPVAITTLAPEYSNALALNPEILSRIPLLMAQRIFNLHDDGDPCAARALLEYMIRRANAPAGVRELCDVNAWSTHENQPETVQWADMVCGCRNPLVVRSAVAAGDIAGIITLTSVLYTEQDADEGYEATNYTVDITPSTDFTTTRVVFHRAREPKLTLTLHKIDSGYRTLMKDVWPLARLREEHWATAEAVAEGSVTINELLSVIAEDDEISCNFCGF